MLHTVRTGTGSVAVESQGSGPPIVMLHGSGSCHECFAPQVEAFVDRYTVITWDAPGYGHSADPSRPLALADYAEAVQLVVKELTLMDSVHLLGVSWGGLVAIAVALRAPSMVRSLALVGASFGAKGDEGAVARTRERIEQFSRSPEKYIEQRVRVLSRGFPNSPVYERISASMRRAVRLPGFDYALTSMIESDVSGQLPEISAPLCLLWGAEDPIAGPACRRMSQLVSADLVCEVPDAGHLANQDQPELVNRQLASFWSECEEGR